MLPPFLNLFIILKGISVILSMIFTPVLTAFSATFKITLAPFSTTGIALSTTLTCFSIVSADLSITLTALSETSTILSAISI